MVFAVALEDAEGDVRGFEALGKEQAGGSWGVELLAKVVVVAEADGAFGERFVEEMRTYQPQ